MVLQLVLSRSSTEGGRSSAGCPCLLFVKSTCATEIGEISAAVLEPEIREKKYYSGKLFQKELQKQLLTIPTAGVRLGSISMTCSVNHFPNISNIKLLNSPYPKSLNQA
jgi:hypothetical protein